MFPVVISEPPGLFSVMPKSFQYFTNDIFSFSYMLYSILYGLRSFQIDSNHLYITENTYLIYYLNYNIILWVMLCSGILQFEIIRHLLKKYTRDNIFGERFNRDKWSKLIYFFVPSTYLIKLSNLLWFADILTITYMY